MRWFRRRRRAARREDTIPAFVELEWNALSRAGTWWTATERRRVADEAIRTVRGASSSLSPDAALDGVVGEAVRAVAGTPDRIDGTDVARWELDGLDPFAYVELLSVASRAVALDTLAFALGQGRPAPPPDDRRRPDRERPRDAALSTGWAPTVGPAGLDNALSAVPREQAEVDRLLARLRPPTEGDTRVQVELARTRAAVLHGCLITHANGIEAMRRRLATTGTELDDGPIVTGCGDTGVVHGAAVVAFTDAVVLRDEEELAVATRRLHAAAGPPGIERVALAVAEAAVTDRLVCGIGVPLVDDEPVIDLRDAQPIGTERVLIG